MSTYTEALDVMYDTAKEEPCPPKTRVGFLARDVFDFTTYEDEMDEILGASMISTLRAIVEKKTFEFIADNANRIAYLTMVNMPFLENRLEWGGSIRGAWIDEGEHCKPLTLMFEKRDDLVITGKNMTEFITDLIAWADADTRNELNE